jgi:transcriptional regulator with XRE-family HTH domain
MDLKDAVAANLRRARHGKNMTQEELADRAELSPRYVSRIETGIASPTVTVLGRLARALDVDPCELVRLRRR